MKMNGTLYLSKHQYKSIGKGHRIPVQREKKVTWVALKSNKPKSRIAVLKQRIKELEAKVQSGDYGATA